MRAQGDAMTFDKRIWKTAVLAAAITLIAGLVVMRMDDWSKGLNSGFVAHGQTGAGGTSTSLPCGSGATGTATACISKTLPHVVGGGGYASIIEIVNTGAVTASISAAFFS